MSHSFFLSLLLLCYYCSYSQKYWDGGGANNLWSDPWNWTGNTIPGSHEDVILDNSIVGGSYTVILPNTLVTVRTVTIRPSVNRNIELILPPSNRQIPGFVASGPGYGMTLYAGAIFRNSSGSGSGGAVNISDSIRINNDGRYVHNTTGGHVSSVQVLSTAGGTESGIFEIDIPAASSTLSLSGRIFGRLILHSAAAGGSCNYTAAGTNRVTVRDDLEIGAGVNLSLNCSDTIFVRGSFMHDGGTFNLGTTTRSVVFHVSQNFIQGVSSVITESGSGTQTVVMGGSGPQLMSVRGSWSNQVAFVKDGTGTVLMKSPFSLPHSLHLKSGKIITTEEWPIILQASCVITADTLSAASCITGPMVKEGMVNGSFLFPVGDQTRMRWIRLEQATGTFTVEYSGDNPRLISNTLGSGLHHISAVEYWTIDALTPTSAAVVKLSFSDPHSGGVTDMRTLRVARLVNTSWQSSGNTAYAGTAGSSGWVNSSSLTGFSSASRTFALASSGTLNPLPFADLNFSVIERGKTASFQWSCENLNEQPEVFELQLSEDGRQFKTFSIVFPEEGRIRYSYDGLTQPAALYYRLRTRGKNLNVWYESNPVRISNKKILTESISVSAIAGQLMLHAGQRTGGQYYFIVYDVAGRIMAKFSMKLQTGRNNVWLPVSNLPPGTYILHVFDRGKTSSSIKFQCL